MMLCAPDNGTDGDDDDDDGDDNSDGGVYMMTNSQRR